MAIQADTAATALAGAWQYMLGAVTGGWAMPGAGAVALATGVPVASLNGVWSTRTDPDPGVIASLLERVAATGLPHCLELRSGARPQLADLAAGRGMRQDQDHPLMVLEDPELLGPAQRVAGLTIRQLDPADAGLHAMVTAAGFAAPQEPFLQLLTPDLLRLPGVRCYLGEAGGRPVTTGLGVTVDGSVGVFDIATVPVFRGLGYGAAITARVVSDGLAAGAAWCWLESSPRAAPLYARLGFRSVATFQPWVSGG
jgi:N-acetylglutamate synthase